MASGDIYRLQQFFRVGSELTENVIHFVETTSETDGVAAKHLVVGWHDKLLPLYNVDLFSEDSKCFVMTARRIDPTPGIPATIVFGGAELAVIEGSDASERVP